MSNHVQSHLGWCNNPALSGLVLACTLTLLYNAFLPQKINDKSKKTITMIILYLHIQNKKLLRAPGLTTRNKKLLGTPGLATKNKNKILGTPCLTTKQQEATRAPGIATRNKKLLGAPGLTTRN